MKHFSKLNMSLFLSVQIFALSSCGAENQNLEGWKYHYIDPQGVINKHALNNALKMYDLAYTSLENKDYISLIDFNMHSGKKRFFVVDMNSGKVKSYLTAHGSGGDKNHDGIVDTLSNTPNSHMSSVGFYKTGKTYSGSMGYSLKLNGISSTNSNARSRNIIIHGASYVSSRRSKMGRSYGCPALEKTHSREVINNIKNNSLIYAFHDSYPAY